MASEMEQILCLREIRELVGDPYGKLMQDELVERVGAVCDLAREMHDRLDADAQAEFCGRMIEAGVLRDA